MKKIFYSTLICTFIACTSNEKEIKSNYQREYSEDGNILLHEGIVINNENQGLHKWYYPSGNLSIINNYQDNSEEGYRLQFFDTTEHIIEIKSYYSNGELLDTLYIYDNKSTCVSKEIYYTDKSYYEKIMLTETGKVIHKRRFVKVDDYSENEYYPNIWIFYDTLGRILSGSSAYGILNKENVYSKDSICSLEVKVLPLYKKEISVHYGNIQKGYNFDKNEILTKKVLDNKFKIPINTQNVGEQTMRFIIKESRKKFTTGEAFKFTYGRYKYVVQ